ncbi:MAG TPA: MASE1 domain-containing protein, partial [Gallionella sp.]|nr:MASE1 domain-containing protein [Gallionella sp.]
MNRAALRGLGKPLLLALAYFVTAQLGFTFATAYYHITLFWLPTGIAVAALLRWKTSSSMTGIWLGALLIELSLGYPILLAGGIATGMALAPLLTYWLLQRWQFESSFNRQRDLFALIAAAALGSLVSASTGVSLLWLENLLQANNAPIAWLNWWLGDALGILLAGPLLLSFTPASYKEFLRQPVESLLCLLLLGIISWLVFFADYRDHLPPLAFLPLPLVIWAALRQGITGTSLAVLLLSAFTAIGTALGKGVFGVMPADEAMYLAWLYMFTIVLTGLMVTTILGERKKTEKALQHTNELLSLAQRKAKAGVWDWELSSNKLAWSDELFLLFGLDPKTSEASFATWLNLIHPDDRQIAEENVNAALANDTPLYNEYRIVLPDGETKWITAVGNTSHYETPHMSGLCIDVTPQKEAQQRARQSELRYKTLIEHAADALFVHDFNGDFVEVNQQACDSLGYSREELLRMNVADTSPHFDPKKGRALWHQLKIGQPHTLISSKRRKDGSTFPAEIRFALLELDGEKRVMTLVSDITTRIEQDEQLRNTLRQLEVKELSKTRFLAAAGHDLRQPIAAANLFLDTLKLTSPTPHQSQLINKLDQSMGIFSSQLERLLDISRFDSGLIKPEIGSFNLAEMFTWLEHNFAESAFNKQLRFKLCFPMNRSLIVRTDIGLLESVLMNLVSNALKFTARGGILISARPRQDSVLLQVWDTGVGISEADLPHIFDEFYQAANPHRNREAGLGLGLSIGQRAMSLLGGSITCRSRPGRGSVFELSLPRNGEPHRPETIPAGMPAPAISSQNQFQGKRVVVLEDDELVSHALICLLQESGAEVRHFSDAEVALQHPDIADSDFYIVDYSLGPGLT